MKLFEVIQKLKTVDEAEKLMAIELSGLEMGLIDVYLIDKLDINSNVKFFDVDTIPNNLEIVVDDVKYVNLFPLTILQEMVEDYSNQLTPQLTNKEIARKLIEYREKDA